MYGIKIENVLYVLACIFAPVALTSLSLKRLRATNNRLLRATVKSTLLLQALVLQLSTPLSSRLERVLSTTLDDEDDYYSCWSGHLPSLQVLSVVERNSNQEKLTSLSILPPYERRGGGVLVRTWTPAACLFLQSYLRIWHRSTKKVRLHGYEYTS